MKLDYQYYNESNYYSDGDIEDVLLQAAKNNQMKELLDTSNQWAVLYHFSDIRENLLEWYPFRKEASLLEVGSGCGALTGLFSKRVDCVTCIELSERRSMINACRNRECDNVRILLGNFQDIQIEEKFDYITLIGVWEYAGIYIGGENPYLKMLERLKQYLKKDGKLLIAIENKMGLKYWNGATEDHTAKMFSGLNDYVEDEGVRTFSRPEIERLLCEAGWNSCRFYYPMPDYKLPDVIYTEERLPQPGEIRDYRKDYNAGRVYNFYDATSWDQICSDGMFPYFANSFLIECGQPDNQVAFAKYNRIRKPDYKSSTVIKKKDDVYVVEKKALTPQAWVHIKQMGKYANKMLVNGMTNLYFQKGCLQEEAYVVDYIDGEDVDALFYQYRNNETLFIEKTWDILNTYLLPNYSKMIDFVMTEEYRGLFGTRGVENAKCLKHTNLDMIFSNLRLAKNGEMYLIDNEWVYDFPIPYEYVIWRAVSQLYSKYMVYLRKRISKKQYLISIGLNEDNFKIYEEMEKIFSQNIIGKDYRQNYRKQAMMYSMKFC